MIKKSKNNENKPDFDVMFNEVQKEIQEKDAEDEVINRTSDLRKLSENIDKATNTWVNATLQLESAIHEYQRAEVKLGNAVNTISDKVDTIKKHIDQVMEDAPTKLKVTVTVCELTGRRYKNFMANGWNRRNRCLPTNTNSRKRYGGSRVTDLRTL
jgi:chromosome segregation ATPase